MNRPLIPIRLLPLVVLALFGPVAPAATETPPPNILLMVADDLGWCDLSCYGNDRVSTPNVDRIAAEGIKLTQFYAAAPVCSPTRASVLTGKYPLRFNIQNAFDDLGSTLPVCVTLPQLLKSAGYVTAHAGKWHLGGVRLKDTAMRDRIPGPLQHGFDNALTQIEEQPLRQRMINQRILYNQGGTCLLRNDARVPADDPYFKMYYEDALAEEAMRRMREAHRTGKPFFINLWWMTPHKPYEPAPAPQWDRTAADGISDDQHRFRSMVARMDFQVGRILALLDELGIADNTLVIFTSDNGGAFEANLGPLKGGKGDLHEGGIRVPFVARWPQHIPANRVNETAIGATTDLLPTLVRAAHARLPADERFDGVDLLPLLSGQAARLDRGPLFWRTERPLPLQRHTPKPQPVADEAVRRGPWKLLALDGKPVELFDLSHDVSESINLADRHPDIVESLQGELRAWLAEPRRQVDNVAPDAPTPASPKVAAHQP